MKIWHILSTLAMFYILFALLLFFFQRNFLYFPSSEYKHPYQTQIFHHDNESINVIVLNQGREKSILYFGGNAEAVVNNAADYIKNFPEHTIYLVNYRGYGGSSGSPDEQALYSDALAIYDQIKSKYQNVSVIGRSLGTGIATYIASKRNIEKMILITPFDSIENIAGSQYPMFPISFLLKDKFDSAGRVNEISAATLIVLAEHDKVIPLKNSMRLIDTFPASQISVITIRSSGHNSISEREKFHITLTEFMRQE